MILNNFVKKIINIFLLIMLITNIFAVVVVENGQPMEEKKPLLNDFQKKVLIWTLIIGLIAFLLTWLIMWIIKKLRDNARKDKDLMFSNYLIAVKNCNQNRDRRMKYRNPFTIFITWKRSDIILNTEEGLKYFGSYDGELTIKDNFVLICCHRPAGFMGIMSEKDIIIIPYELRKLLHKDNVAGKTSLVINCESIDEALNTDYFNQIVIKNPNNSEQLVNFNEYIVKEYMEKYVYRQTIKDNLLNYHQSMNDVVELNPNIQASRKDPKG